MCVICDKMIHVLNYVICQKCNAVSEWNYKIVGPDTLDIKSTCCNADVNIQQKITCSDLCHTKFVDFMVEESGEFKKVLDMETGKFHKVPTRLIIEEGITQSRLKEFPEWIN